jgi:hypothetical protein
MAVAANSFDAWLSKKLQALNTDEGVFGTYIRGILEGDETEDEKTEALESILAGITVRERMLPHPLCPPPLLRAGG